MNTATPEQMKTNAGRAKSLAGFWLRLTGLLLLFSMAFTYAVYILTPKYDYGVCSMMNLYRQPKDTVDVLVVGTSMAYAGVNTNVLWREYGIAAYDLCSAEEPFWISYYSLKEALKSQRPQLIILDAKACIYTNDYSKRGRTILSTYGILGLENRTGAILASVETAGDALSFLLAMPEIHNNYQDVKPSDFVCPPDNGGRGETWKGHIEVDEIDRHEKPSLVYNKVKRNINDREEAYARKIFDLARSEGLPLMLIGMPNPDYANDHMYYNALWAIAEEYGFSGINYNDPALRFGLRYSSDFADWQHLNVKGGVTFSRKLGADLKEAYDLPDRRGDARYASYDACAEKWYSLLPSFTSSGVAQETAE